MSVKVCDLAKQLGVSNDDVLEQLQKLYVEVEDDKSKIDEKIADLVRVKFGWTEPKKVEKTKKTEEKKPKEVKSKKEKVKSKEIGEKEDKKVKSKKSKVKSKEAEGEEAEEVKSEKEKVESKEEVKSEEVKEKTAEEKIKEKTESKIRIVKRAKVEPPKAEVKKKEIAKEAEAVKPQKLVKKKDTFSPDDIISKKEKIKVKKVLKLKPGFKGLKNKPRIKKVRRSGSFQSFEVLEPAKTEARKTPLKIKVNLPVNIRDLAVKINKKPNELIQYIMGKGVFANINQDLEEDLVRDIMSQFGYELELHDTVESIEKELVAEHHDTEKAEVEVRAPVVTFMGHVDHGKTSLLDFIRNTRVTSGEKGGITQHIGAYKVKTIKGAVTFLDTPGHAAFTAMRARGANATDVVVLVVAADDGVMPQTKEAIDHARAAGVPIVVAINKCDLPDADPEMVKRELQKEDLAPEDWGGDTVMVEVSAKSGEGVDILLEMLMLESELLELKANPKLKARGVVIEGKKTPGQGVVVTLLVQNGTLLPGDVVLCGSHYGKIKAMMNDLGTRVDKALPATPVEVLGVQGVPLAGDEFFVVKDEKKAKSLSILKQGVSRKGKMAGNQRVSLEDFHSRILEGTMKELKIILKADVQGSLEALEQSLEELGTDEVKLNIIHSAVGDINESDAMLAMVSNGVIIGFHVKIDGKAGDICKSENIDSHVYDVIYEAIEDMKASLEGLLEPEEIEVFQGSAQVIELFSASKIGKVAGCSVTKGVIHRKDRVRIKRADEVVFEGNIDALKRFKDDVKEVKEGFECGISFKGFNDARKNDIIEAFIIEKIARRLEK